MPRDKQPDPVADDTAPDDIPDFDDPPVNLSGAERGKPRGPSEVDEVPDYVETNKPEDALTKQDPEGPMLDHQDPDAGIKERKHPENPDTPSPDHWGNESR